MLTLHDDCLRFSFPEITAQVRILAERHIEEILSEFLPCEDELRACARELAGLDDDLLDTLEIDFRRTLRIPDDGKVYPLPAGLGNFPLRSVDDFSDTIPELWRKRGGVTMPMYQSEALWIRFASRYPFAVKIGSGKINTVSVEPWSPDLSQDPQSYIVTPGQRWLDGFCVGEGIVRQFVAMPMGAGGTVEEQVTGHAEVGGMQFQVHPMKADFYFQEIVEPSLPSSRRELYDFLFRKQFEGEISRALPRQSSALGLGAGGTMRQEIYEDEYTLKDWDQTQSSRCFVHLANSMIWRQVTGENPPHPPLTATEYKEAGIPWFDYYRDDLKPVKGSKVLAKVKSVFQFGEEKKSQTLPENSSLTPELIIQYGNTRRPGEIREFFDIP